MTTTYFSITSEGGRIGRITWDNTTIRSPGCRPYHSWDQWGSIQWDRRWPEIKRGSIQLDLGPIILMMAKFENVFRNMGYTAIQATAQLEKFKISMNGGDTSYENSPPPEKQP